MSLELVHLDVHEHVATITLDSAANRNALSRVLRGQLLEALAAAVQDGDVRVVVLTHSGTVFCSGLDLKEAAAPTTEDERATFGALLLAVWNAPKPVVARLAGSARAGGVGLMAACDIAIASDEVSFAFTEVRLGLVPAVISVMVLPRMLTPAAHELFLTAESFDAQRALQVGLLNRVVPPGALDDEVRRYTSMLALGAPNAMAATKRMLREPVPDDIDDALGRRSALSASHFSSAEGREGMRAFVEKRPPAWTGAAG